jgi:hypothetical protein
MSDDSYLFEVMTPLGFTVRCTESYWLFVSTVKHKAMNGRLDDVKQTLSDPIEIRQSTKDIDLMIFYRSDEKRFVCVVARRLNGEGFLITTYPVDKIKRGKQIWSK